ncbi:hypothetical protein Tsubulata_027531 [Turnera subulata]|uniref:Uncharacterized protein n=1 Tax=Turnera subulata TaxID=218843 RepID=A0A9Q0JDD6_9ROSI|nr:hypothetical protein Tsubulata_027531 [Turnera subulata]
MASILIVTGELSFCQLGTWKIYDVDRPGCFVYFHPRIKPSFFKAAHDIRAKKRQMAEERRLAEELSEQRRAARLVGRGEVTGTSSARSRAAGEEKHGEEEDRGGVWVWPAARSGASSLGARRKWLEERGCRRRDDSGEEED